MKNSFEKTERQKEFLNYLEKNVDLKRVTTISSKLLGPFVMCLISRESAMSEKKLARVLCKSLKKGEHARKSCIRMVNSTIKKAEKSKKNESFKCSVTNYGFCFPLVDNNEAFGYIIAWRLQKEPPPPMIAFFAYFVETTLRGTKKELDLNQLYKTIQPRAIALSTVHTVHRLISSSLYLDELLSRIARLSMQIIKANRCSIKLLDSKKKTLLPKATVDLRTKKAKLKKVKIGRWAPGKAVKYEKSIWSNQYLATPLIDEETIGVITLYDKVDNQPFDNFDVEIMKTLAEQSAIAIKNAQLYREQEKLTMGSIKALAQIIESKGTGIGKPKTSFLRIVHLIGQEFDMRQHELKTLQYATLLHDAGELMVPDEVLRKKGKLTDKEYRLIKEHPLKGARIIKSLKSLKSIAPIIMYHHENFDGTGYPKGLKGGNIPMGARIMAIVAAFEAMITKRSYRITLPINRAIQEIEKNSGMQFDPTVVKVFLKIVKRKDVARLLKKEIYGYK
ncbi:MAG: HD domain-containing protein [Candidatus Omnitrophica bacterium]|nr:HD domain-containing protein [Candidatus Omnitrophota bacterium]